MRGVAKGWSGVLGGKQGECLKVLEVRGVREWTRDKRIHRLEVETYGENRIDYPGIFSTTERAISDMIVHIREGGGY